MRIPRRRASAFLVACALAASATLAGSAAHATELTMSAASKTGTNVAGYCSQAGGFHTNAYAPVSTLRLTVSPASPRAGAKMTVRVFVVQRQFTPPARYYPARILRGEVVIGVSGRNATLFGPVNPTQFTGAISAAGWTAKAVVKAPGKGLHRIVVKLIVYNVRGGGSGGWGKPYAGFDLVCSGGLNPTVTTTAYAQPRLTLRVRTP